MTIEEAKKKYRDTIAHILASQGSPERAERKQKAWRQYEADLFRFDGSLDVFHSLQNQMMLNWSEAAIKYTSTGDKRALAVYLKERVDNCTKFYEDELVRVGLATGTHTDAEREDMAIKSWITELTAGTENILSGGGVVCEDAIKATRKYFHKVHQFVPLLIEKDIKPVTFNSQCHKNVYNAPLEDVYDKTITSKQRADYDADKSYRD